MKNLFSLLLLVTVLFLSCKTADNKVPQIAADFCNCFAKMEKDMSAEAKKVFTTAAESADPETALQEEVMKLDEETQGKVGTEFMALGEVEDENSEVGRCMKNVEKKYNNAYTLNQSKFLDKVIKELEQKPGCSFTAALMKLGKKVEEKEKGK